MALLGRTPVCLGASLLGCFPEGFLVLGEHLGFPEGFLVLGEHLFVWGSLSAWGFPEGFLVLEEHLGVS